MKIEQQTIQYCAKCSPAILGEWKGWPHRDCVPHLPRIISGSCEVCGSVGSDYISNTDIAWLNHHGPYSTGLPEYWLLVISEGWLSKWGSPYYAETNCRKCGGRGIISEMKYPNGTRELASNCQICGVKKVLER
jgi:ribosomal protein S14